MAKVLRNHPYINKIGKIPKVGRDILESTTQGFGEGGFANIPLKEGYGREGLPVSPERLSPFPVPTQPTQPAGATPSPMARPSETPILQKIGMGIPGLNVLTAPFLMDTLRKQKQQKEQDQLALGQLANMNPSLLEESEGALKDAERTWKEPFERLTGLPIRDPITGDSNLLAWLKASQQPTIGDQFGDSLQQLLGDRGAGLVGGVGQMPAVKTPTELGKLMEIGRGPKPRSDFDQKLQAYKVENPNATDMDAIRALEKLGEKSAYTPTNVETIFNNSIKQLQSQKASIGGLVYQRFVSMGMTEPEKDPKLTKKLWEDFNDEMADVDKFIQDRIAEHEKWRDTENERLGLPLEKRGKPTKRPRILTKKQYEIQQTRAKYPWYDGKSSSIKNAFKRGLINETTARQLLQQYHPKEFD